MRLQLKAPEGFYQVGWQRVQAFNLNDGNKNVSVPVGRIYEGWCLVNIPEVISPRVCDDCFFVISGESFTLEDLAQSVSEVMKCTVEAVNED